MKPRPAQQVRKDIFKILLNSSTLMGDKPYCKKLFDKILNFKSEKEKKEFLKWLDTQVKSIDLKKFNIIPHGYMSNVQEIFRA